MMHGLARKIQTVSLMHKGATMKNVIIVLVMGIILAAAVTVYAVTMYESGEKSAKPVVWYGIESDGTLTAVLVDSSGVAQTTS